MENTHVITFPFNCFQVGHYGPECYVALMPAKPPQVKSKHLTVMSHQCHTMSHPWPKKTNEINYKVLDAELFESVPIFRGRVGCV